MKKILLSFAAVALFAVGAQAQVSYGIKAGVNMGKYSNVDESMKDYAKFNPSYYLTGYADLSVAPNFSIQPGISLQGKGAKFKNSEGGASVSISQDVMSIEIPVNLVYYIPTGDAGTVFLGAGPYAGYAISGKNKVKWSGITDFEDEGFDTADGSLSTDIEFGKDKDMKPFDAGVNFLAGFKLSNGFLINAGYGLGLTNLSTSSDSDDKFSNRVISVGIGFQF